MSKKYTSWIKIKKSKKIEFVEDPILNFELSKEYFEDSYKKIVEKLNGDEEIIESCIEYYFELHPLRKNTLMFKDENKKIEFYDIGIENNSVTSLKKINEGSQNED